MITKISSDNTCSKRFDSDLPQSSSIFSPTGDTSTESFKMVSNLEKSSDLLCVSPCVSPIEGTERYATHANIFFRYFEKFTPDKSIDSIDQMQKNAFGLIRKKTSDQTTNHPKKSKTKINNNCC